MHPSQESAARANSDSAQDQRRTFAACPDRSRPGCVHCGPASPVAGSSRVRWCSRCSSAPWPGRPGRPARRTAPRTCGSRSGPVPAATSRSISTRASSCRTAPRPAPRCRRCCWRTASAEPRKTRGPTRKILPALGYAVLTYTARGFGLSGGQIHLDNPDYEVRDAQRLLDWLAARPEIRKDADGDPRVGVVGGSYGGGLALLLAAQDQRVDAIVPMITWNDLARSFLPEDTGGTPENGVFKKQLGRAVLRRRSGGRDRPGRTRRRGRGRRRRRGPAARARGRSVVRPVRRRRLRRLPAHRDDRPGRRRRGRAAAPVQPGRCARPDQGADAARAGHGRHALPALRGGRQRARASRRPARPVRVAWFTGGPRRRRRPAVRPGPRPVPHGAVARPLRQGRRATPRRRLHLVDGSPASTRSTAAWSPAGSPATSTPGSAAPRRPR